VEVVERRAVERRVEKVEKRDERRGPRAQCPPRDEEERDGGRAHEQGLEDEQRLGPGEQPVERSVAWRREVRW
jgi:hypothetical protein